VGENRIMNTEKMGRLIDFSGLPKVKRCSPTDIDMFMEIGQDVKRFMMGEFKEAGKPITKGQRLVMERTCNAYASIGYTSYGLFIWHFPELSYMDIVTGLDIIPAEHAIVHQIYHAVPHTTGTWIEQDVRQSVVVWYHDIWRFEDGNK